ncbi:DinB family protein [Fluviicola sp.]|uniref:DinB family protein n=1 Tax=Fluviicola sp. TaxID=1917219 RepID=UPI0031DB28E8
MTTQWVFNEVATITERNIQQLKSKFSHYSENQLTWKPNPETWSLAEVFAHLNAYAKFYHQTLNDRIDRTRFRTPRINYTSSPLGKSAWVSMKLGNARNVKRKFNAPNEYNPTVNPSLVTGNEISALLQGQQEFLTIIEKSVAVNLKKVKVPISISKLVRLRLGDALLFVAYHNDRHMEQALKLTKHPQFPKK